MSQVRIEVVEGVAGVAIYINAYRIAGPKPWGGGIIRYSFKADRKDIERALSNPATDAPADTTDVIDRDHKR